MLRTLTATTLAATVAGSMAFAAAHEEKMNIVETAQDAGNFTTLITAVEAAELGDTLTGEGPFTVFAPTDEAFDALPDGTVEELTMDENQQQLTDILTYHVVPMAAMSGDLSDGQEIETVNGEMLTVSIDGDTVMIDGATVTQADIEASNGVIHVIDTVLMPGSDM
ncbi:Cell surface lipoprotein MPB83 precursor [Rhodobacteraceae bacterium THAF1]|uniref:fasciclin domain-containing protein n=1 Tax=Palleronia sp. THAF1 TaxID=2587842 RepID=UPI000F4168E8|nr:fasciclin domain-containing protein [Palleronia sp. THAF1]QFU08664.1 Immunogenic protein MPT70 precursor [Palleronia sp. THAF1]VDC28411.1 Cell surface lipoprotein MPB83 precursor [Rhodobacteraceae bacterium THAF1]